MKQACGWSVIWLNQLWLTTHTSSDFSHIHQSNLVIVATTQATSYVTWCFHRPCVQWQHSFPVYYTPAQRSWRPRPTKLEGGYTGFTLSVCPSVHPSTCRRHGFRSISQVCFGISISNFICILMVAIGRSLLIFSDDTYKMAAWRPYWIFWFPDSNFTLALNINFKLQRHNTYVYG